MGLSSSRSLRGSRVALSLAGLCLCVASAQADNPMIRYFPDYGKGDAGMFRVAVLTDLHIGHWMTSSLEDLTGVNGDYDYGDPDWYGAFSGRESTFAQYLRNSVGWMGKFGTLPYYFQ